MSSLPATSPGKMKVVSSRLQGPVGNEDQPGLADVKDGPSSDPCEHRGQSFSCSSSVPAQPCFLPEAEDGPRTQDNQRQMPQTAGLQPKTESHLLCMGGLVSDLQGS